MIVSQTPAAAASASPNQSACTGSRMPIGRGRSRVRSMSASMSRSAYWLMAFAPPAASMPPMSVAAMSHGEGQPSAASTIAGTVVTSSSQMMRGFVSAM